MGLEEYAKKRDFKKTAEPKGKLFKGDSNLKFVIQKHAASHLHYDFRLELDGVLKSWAVPKGPSLDPGVKRLAMMVEDHPYDYKDFEGIIPEGNYGAGKVIIWDEGFYHSLYSDNKGESENQLKQGLHKGDLKFVLHGKKVNGAFALVKMKGDEKNTWLLIKKKDEFASTEEITLKDRSVKSNKKIEEMGKNDAVWTGESEQRKAVKEKKKSIIKDINIDLSAFPVKKMFYDVKPMLATLIDKPFNNKDWIFEIKLDGYRAITEVENGTVNIYSRNNRSFNYKFRNIAQELKNFSHDVVFDGEAVILNDEGKPDFQLMQSFQTSGRGDLVYYVFDILFLDGHDLTEAPLIQRKELLRQILPVNEIIRYSDHIEEHGIDFYKAALEQRLEGIVAKDKNCTYKLNKRTKDWLKIKTRQSQEAIICGFTKPKGSRNYFGSLVLGVYKGKELKYIGQSGGGFNEQLLKDLKRKLDTLVTDNSPFKEKVTAHTKITWVKPKLICEVSFSEWTEEDLMRHPIFLGLREDKNAENVIMEKPDDKEAPKINSKTKQEVIIGGHKLTLTNLDKIYWPDEGYTKGDLIEYYRSVSKFILPYLKDRPESLLRHPNGIHGKSFFQKNVDHMPPDWVKTELIYSDHNKENINYLICNDEATLVFMANLGCIEINPWFSHVPTLEYPDYLVIDLDPEEISFDKVVEAALKVKEVLDEAGAKSYCKTSGATGLHIYVPLKAKYNYDIAKDFAHIIARIAYKRIPEFTSLERSPKKRQGKVYLDYLQNRGGQTLAAPYSVRPKPGATVATPLLWEEVKVGLSPSQFTIKNIQKRLKEKGDLFKPVLGAGINIEKCIKKLNEQISDLT